MDGFSTFCHWLFPLAVPIVGSGLNWLCFLSPLFGPDNLLGGLYIGTYRFFLNLTCTH